MSIAHWNYFISIEQDIKNLSKYIEFDEGNFKVFSIEIAKILMTASQEVDVLLKATCKLHKQSYSNINEYFELVKSQYPRLLQTEVTLRDFLVTRIPFESWKKNKPPKWWTANNKVKHHRDTDFKQATLENVIDAVGALFLTNIIYQNLAENSQYFEPQEPPKIFMPEKDLLGTRGFILKFCYKAP